MFRAVVKYFWEYSIYLLLFFFINVKEEHLPLGHRVDFLPVLQDLKRTEYVSMHKLAIFPKLIQLNSHIIPDLGGVHFWWYDGSVQTNHHFNNIFQEKVMNFTKTTLNCLKNEKSFLTFLAVSWMDEMTCMFLLYSGFTSPKW